MSTQANIHTQGLDNNIPGVTDASGSLPASAAVGTTLDEQFLPRLVAIFFALFHPTEGPKVVYQVPEGSISHHGHKIGPGVTDRIQENGPSLDFGLPESYSSTNISDSKPPEASTEPLFDFSSVEDYLIPKEPLCGRLVTCTTRSCVDSIQNATLANSSSLRSDPSIPTRAPANRAYKILSHPMLISNEARYARNNFIFNLAFVFDARADVRAYEAIVNKCARSLASMEESSCFLSSPNSQPRMLGVIEQLYEDLSSYAESFIALPVAPHSRYERPDASKNDASTFLCNRGTNASGAVQVFDPFSSERFKSPILSSTLAAERPLSAPSHTPNSPLTRVPSQPNLVNDGSSQSPSPHRGGTRAFHNKRVSSDDHGSVSSLPRTPDRPRAPSSSALSTTAPISLRRPSVAASSSTPVNSMTAVPSPSPQTTPVFRSGTTSSPTINPASRRRLVSQQTKSAALATVTDTVASGSTADSQVLEQGSDRAEEGLGLVTDVPDAALLKSSASSSAIAHGDISLQNSMNISIGAAPTEHNNGTNIGHEANLTAPDISILPSDNRKPNPSRRSSPMKTPRFGEEIHTSTETNQRKADIQDLLTSRTKPRPHGLGRTVRDALNLKLFPVYPNPPTVHDWDVPVALIDLSKRLDANWDLTMARIFPFINGVNHLRRIAQRADADLELTRQCIEHLLYYGCVIMIDIFQFRNIYAIRPSISHMAEDKNIQNECGSYVTRPGYPIPPWPTMLALYASLRQGRTVHDWIEAEGVDDLGIDVRRFITFGVIKGFLRRVHRYPVLLSGIQTTSGYDSTAAAQTGTTESIGRSSYTPKFGYHNSKGIHYDQDSYRRIRHGSFEPPYTSNGYGGAQQEQFSSELGSVSTTRPDISTPSQLSSSPPKGRTSRHSRHLPRTAHRHPTATVVDAADVALGNVGPSNSTSIAHQSHFNEQYSSHEKPLSQHESGDIRLSGPLNHESQPNSASRLHPHSSTKDYTTGGNRIRRNPKASEWPDTDSNVGFVKATGTRGYSSGRTTSTWSTTYSDSHSKHQRSSVQPLSEAPNIPPTFLALLDGTHHDDELCVRFGISWTEIESILLYVGTSMPNGTTSNFGGPGGPLSTPPVTARTTMQEWDEDAPFPNASGFALPGHSRNSTSGTNTNTDVRERQTASERRHNTQQSLASNPEKTSRTRLFHDDPSSVESPRVGILGHSSGADSSNLASVIDTDLESGFMGNSAQLGPGDIPWSMLPSHLSEQTISRGDLGYVQIFLQ